MSRIPKAMAFGGVAVCFIAILVGCKRNGGASSGDSSSKSVVLYTSVDEPYVRPLVEQFERETGIAVTLLTDSEASKSVGLAGRLEAERDHPKADVWWDNECFLSIRLADEGVLAPYESTAAADLPAEYKDAAHRWAGSALRVRVMVSAPSGAAAGAKPAHLTDLLRPEWKGKIAIARPTAGTTGGHVAALYVAWGDDRADAFFKALHDNGVHLVGGNSMVADSVARGDLLAGLCDNDDAASAVAEIGKLDMALPDQAEGEPGTLAMPCAVGLIAGCPHPDAARKLIDYLLSAPVDRALVQAHFAWCSARNPAAAGRFLRVDYAAVAHAMPIAIRRATNLLEAR